MALWLHWLGWFWRISCLLSLDCCCCVAVFLISLRLFQKCTSLHSTSLQTQEIMIPNHTCSPALRLKNSAWQCLLRQPDQTSWYYFLQAKNKCLVSIKGLKLIYVTKLSYRTRLLPLADRPGSCKVDILQLLPFLLQFRPGSLIWVPSKRPKFYLPICLTLHSVCQSYFPASFACFQLCSSSCYNNQKGPSSSF